MVDNRIPVFAGPVNGSELCLQCGMCCDGTLFNPVDLDDSETDHMRELGLQVVERTTAEGQQRWSFPQPCTQYQDGCCSIYDEQPRVCNTYTCRLLDGYIEGSRSLDDCLEVLGRVREIAAEAQRHSPKTDDLRSATPEALMSLTLFDVVRKRYFKRPHESSDPVS